MKKIGYIITGLVLAAAIVVAVIVSESQSEQQSLSVRTVSPQRKTIVVKKTISGNLYPIKEIEVKSAISGTLETYYVSIGNHVRQGDRIAKIKILSEPSQIENAKTNLATARIVYEKDRLNYEREKNLFEKGVVTAAEFEEASKTYNVSREQCEYMQNQLHLLVEGYIPSSNISNVVVAASDGVVTDLPPEEGSAIIERNTFSDGTTIAVIARLDSFLFKGRVIESDVLILKQGMTLTVRPTSMDGFSTQASIRKISPKGRMEQGIMKYDLEAVFALPDSVMIYSGFNATADFIVEERIDALTLPEAYITFSNDSAYIEVPEKGKTRKMHIETGISDGIDIEITGGLDENTKVVKK